MLSRASIFLLVALAYAADGLNPRPTPADYPVHQTGADNLAIAAVLPTRDVLKRSFPAYLSRDWIIVEVAVYPGDAAVKLKPTDFALKMRDHDTVTIIHPVEPRDVAASERPAHERPQFGQPHGSVGYETTIGGGIHEQRTGGEIASGIDQPSPPPPGAREHDQLEAVLSSRSLPYGSASAPVAGYLYFPQRSKKRNKLQYELHYISPAGSVTLELPVPPR